MSENEVMDAPAVPIPPKRPRWPIIMVMLLLFLSGLIIGGGSTAIFMVRRARQAISHPEERSARFVMGIARRLDLTPEQREQIREIVHKHEQRLQEIRRDFMPQVREEFQSMEDEIALLLTPEQRKMWHELARRRQNWMPPAQPPQPGEGRQFQRRRQMPPEERPRQP